MLSQKLAIALQFAALISSSAFAELPHHLTPKMLAGDAQSLGAYTVTEESSPFHAAGNLCDHPEEGEALSCGDKVWAYRNDSGIILISALDKDAISKNELMVWTVEGKKCKGYADISEALSKGIFNLGLCELEASTDNPSQLSSVKDINGADVLFDAIFLLSGMVLGPHTTSAMINSADLSSITILDIYKTQFVRNTMTLIRAE
jgi:hypothetical protein